jgi:diacylglycerol kinase
MDSQFIILYALLIFIFWSLLVSPYLVSSTRQKLFSIRDKAFLDFEHDNEYRKLRDNINLFIRFADKASWQRMLFDFIFLHKELKKAQSNKTNFKNSEFKKILFISTILIVRLVVLRSPTIILLSMPLFIVAIVQVEILPKIKNIVSSFVIKDANIHTTQKTA